MIPYLVSLIVLATGLWAATHALLSKRDPKSALTWIVISLFLPIAGPLIYLVLGVNRIEQKSSRAIAEDEPGTTNNAPLSVQEKSFGHIALIGKNITGLTIEACDSLRMLVNGEEFYPALLTDIRAAKESIYLCTYIFRNDSTGAEIAGALHDAMNRGVEVRVIVDGLGAIVYRPSILKLLREYKIDYRLFNPLKILPPSLRINMRNHRKLLIIDDVIAYTGGQNLSSRHLVDVALNVKRTRDLHFRFEGDVVDDLAYAFEVDWAHSGGDGGPVRPKPARNSSTDAESWTRVIMDGPSQNLDKLNELLVGVISAAKQRVWIMTPYFLPGLDIVGALIGAKLRGVDVKILLPERTNVHIAHWASQHNLQFILAKKFEIVLLPRPFIHTKAILIDDSYSLVGSANLDPRSLRLNFELNVEVFSETFNSTLSNYFDEQLGNSEALRSEQLLTRPRWIKIRDAIAWLFTPYL